MSTAAVGTDVADRFSADAEFSWRRPHHTRAGRTVLCGFAGSVLIALGGIGVGDIPRADDRLQRWSMAWLTYGHGRSLSSLLFWAGTALLVVSWITLGRILIGRSTAPVATGLLRQAAVTWSLPLLVTVPLYSRDVYAYLAQSALLRDGFNPYVDGPARNPGPLVDSMAQVWATTTAPYGPFFMGVARGVVEVTGDDPVSGVLAMRLVFLPGWLLAIWAVPAIATHLGRDPRVALWVSVLNPMLLVHDVGGPHVEMLMSGVLAAGVLLALRRHHVAGVIVIAVAMSIKVTAGVALPFVLWIWLAHTRSQAPPSRRAVLKTVSTIVGVSVAVFAVFTAALGLGLGWLHGLGYADRIINYLSLPTAVAHLVTVIAAPVAAIPLWPVVTVSRAVGAVILGLALIWIWWTRRADERSAVTGIAVAMLAVLLLEPSTLPWYYTWTLIFAGAAVLSARVLAVIVAGAVFGLIAFQPDDSILLYETSGVLKTVAASAFCVWLLLHRDRRGPLVGQVTATPTADPRTTCTPAATEPRPEKDT
ncbi:alpha-(1-_6)-mannopyranosyltransferase A [Williamsia sp. CHRR-6]|uniref:alpha-(1->6)-mannopyranosyltransferase A n=1 Tax=Williamsia sp. CHRR-6 TaxID=2835871 RepID=UPI001BD9C374|nr:alpha-(1->6)-mannopyranosyltransferase A [Williamsia sp. CHRR-6]MBT0565281.1 alpha-(1->6)-mannopyranosyltransferase A [Williamsia sp. CHRR-6]